MNSLLHPSSDPSPLMRLQVAALASRGYSLVRKLASAPANPGVRSSLNSFGTLSQKLDKQLLPVPFKVKPEPFILVRLVEIFYSIATICKYALLLNFGPCDLASNPNV